MAKTIKVWSGTEWVAVGVQAGIISDASFQTFSNKTISGSINTLSNIPNSALTNSAITINGSAVSLGGSTSITTGPASSTVSSNITLAANNKYFVNTAAARTLSLPASASVGDAIEIYDATGTAATYNITITPNSLKINGSIQNYIIDVNGAATTLTYTGLTYGWKVR
jgi:hypothetical protein